MLALGGPPVRTLIAGTPSLLVFGMAAALGRDPRLALVGQVDSAAAAAGRLRHDGGDQLDVVVVRASQPRATIGELGEALDAYSGAVGDAEDERGQRPLVLMLTDNERREELVGSLRLGVRGFGYEHAVSPDELCAGVYTLSRSGWWACPLATRHLMDLAIDPDRGAERALAALPQGHDGGPLSEREVAVLHLVSRGLREDEIARQLSLSPNTVKTYMRRIRIKLNVRSGAQAIAMAVRDGLLPDRRKAPRQADAA
jgi:DNA-binding NarL/FixJ family response regulator